MSGYAYGGGGIGLTRVEVSFDDGKVRRLERHLSLINTITVMRLIA